ncbi:MAG: 3-dehydroquinate dehydratase [Clostridia bacterium]|nr:3-dehydroquinate dehydratase [Clostridia bacterium]
MKKKILVLNGPNLNMLGIREPEIYGRKTYRDLVDRIEEHAKARGAFVTVYQSNSEAVLVTKIQRAYGIYDGIILNPAAYTHTSVALLDALKAVGIPAVEVHISDVSEREDFRQVSYVRLAAVRTIMGRGFDGYLDAMDFLLDEVLADDGGKR